MNIIPSSEVRLLSGCKMKPDYKHTAWWISPENQYNYFSGKTKYTLANSQYTRSTENWIKVPYTVAQLLDCNYMIITNLGHENKHYYAFITKVEYVSEAASKVWYEIDLIQTWYFECELMPCLVEREHSVTDVIGENILPEPVAIGDYVDYVRDALPDWTLDDCYIIAVTCLDIEEGFKVETVNKEMIGKTYSGLHFHAFEATQTGIEQLAALITFDTLNPFDSIVSIFMCPKVCYDRKTKTISIATAYYPFEGYTPHNNKLFTFPYHFLRITAGDCGLQDYKYELFNRTDGLVQFTVEGDLSCQPAMMLSPVGYRSQSEGDGSLPDHDDCLMLTGFPECAWGSDMFVAFLSQVASISATVTGHVGNMTSQEPSMGMVPASASYGQPVFSNNDLPQTPDLHIEMNPIRRHMYAEKKVRNTTNSTALFNLGRLEFEYIIRRVTPEYAKIIDEFFDRYGYATNRVKVPNRTSRPQWNYVKTKNCCINASLPSDIVTEIESVYNNGITFWNYADNIGNYSLDNKPR